MRLFGFDRGGDDYAIRRRQMVEKQLVPRGITDERVLGVMGKLPRHKFVEEALQAKAYSDNALPIGLRQTISQPYIVAVMAQLLQVRPEDRVLEIGTGSGYQTAVLAALAGSVHTVERIRALANRARGILRELGVENIYIRVGDGTAGWPEEAPFDRIIVAAGSPSVPEPLREQLDVNGRLVIPVGDEREQVLEVVERTSTGYRTGEHDHCVFVKLIGRKGWRESPDRTS